MRGVAIGKLVARTLQFDSNSFLVGYKVFFHLLTMIFHRHLWIAVTIVNLLSRVCASPAHIMDSIDAEKVGGYSPPMLISIDS